MRILALTLTFFAAALLGGCGDKASETTKTGDHEEGTHDHDGDEDHHDEDGHDHDGDGDHKDEHASMAKPLEGASWDGGEFDPAAKSDMVRVIVFFKPG